MKKFFTKRTIYIILFTILYAVVAFSSFYHAVAFFGLANNLWMSVILAFAFEIGQAAVLLSLLTSSKDRKRIMPWILMTMFTLVQVIGNVFSSYKYLVTHSSGDLQYFKEPIFIWTDIPDNEANVIITYIVGAILPITALLLTGMITNYLNDTSEENSNNQIIDDTPSVSEKIEEKPKENVEEKVENIELEKEPEINNDVIENEVIDDIITKFENNAKANDQKFDVEDDITNEEINKDLDNDLNNDLNNIPENVLTNVKEPVKEPLINHKEVAHEEPVETTKEIKSRFLN